MKKLLTFALALMLALTLCVPAFAFVVGVTALEASATSSELTVSGTANTDAVMVEMLNANGGILVMTSLNVENGEFSARIGGLSLAAGTYTVRAADYDGGIWRTTEVTVTAPVIPPAADGALVITVSGDTAQIAAEKLAGATSLTVNTASASLSFDTSALAAVKAASGEAVLTAKTVDVSTLPAEQRRLLGENTLVLELSLTVGGKPLTDFGGMVTVELDYELKDGETAEGMVVWFMTDDGELAPCETKYENGKLIFKTPHFSKYAVGFFPFDDVTGDKWYYERVIYAYNNKLFTGTGDKSFSPEVEMTRAMLVTVLYRMEGEPEMAGESAFTDVKDGEYYADAVAWAHENGIVDGYGDGRFGTDDSVTREQTAALLLRYAKYKGYDTSNTATLESYTDADAISTYAIEAMRWANAEGLITGRTATTLVPAGTAKRCELAGMLMSFLES